VEAADRHCGGRVVSTLEGGYNLFHLARSVAAHVKELAGAA
jgi:acetoin utilization deacetylase AcuC-like enzyme